MLFFFNPSPQRKPTGLLAISVLTRLALWVEQDVSSKYSLGRVLGKGQFGTTRLAEEKATGKELACKSISKRKLTCVL